MSDAVVTGFRAGRFRMPTAPAVIWQVRQEGATRARAIPIAVPLIAIALTIAATVVSATHGWMTLYNDSRTHLDIARRVTDGLTPGLAQLGSVWLPIPQLLMAPLAAIEWFWHSGAAGAVVSGAAFAYSAVRIFSLTEELVGSRAAAWCAFVLYATNLNLLYLQSTALDEPLMLACTVGAVYHLARWTRTAALADLALTGVFTFVATLTRYEGWGLFVAIALIVIVWTRLRSRRHAHVQANALLYLAIAGYGIGMWFLYNLIIFGDPLYFMHSSFSAQAQQVEWAKIGYLPTKGNVPQSLLTVGWAMLDVMGPAVLAAASVGAVLLLVRRRPELLRNIAIMIALAAPITFSFLSLLAGQTTIRVPELPPYQMFNLRYAIEALPLVALCGGSLAMYLRGAITRIPAVAVALVLSLLLLSSTPAVLAEGLTGVSSYANQQVAVATQFMHQHFHGGEILADDFQAGPFIFASGYNLSQFVTIGFHPYYENALKDPAANVRWVVTYTSDTIAQQIQSHPDRYAKFKVVFHDDPITLYELTGS